jgi:hypothetical protein
MKRKIAVLLAFAGFLLASDSTFPSAARAQSLASAPEHAVVVVELFTSEGCSTCPPADSLLLKLEEQQGIEGAEVIAIEEHVDYWNHDGWIDPFSSSEWTMRQQDYAATFKIDGVYTPQMVIDGREQFIGSRINQVSDAIRRNARRRKAKVAISQFAAAGKPAREFQVTLSDLVDPPEGDVSEVWLLITEKGLRSHVNAGENAGKNLQHASVVRRMRKLGVANGKEARFSWHSTVKLKPSWNAQNLRAVALLQAHRSKQILGAASLAIAR